MFKGYIKTDGKVPLEKYSNVNLMVEPPLGDYAGILDKDYIQIDIDDQNQAATVDKVINDLGICSNILETRRGLHFYFKNTSVKSNRIGSNTPIGVNVDIKIGLKNTAVPLVVNGSKRKWRAFYGGDVDDLPEWLLPIQKASTNWFDLGQGDGRNQALFNHILTLQAAGLSKASTVESVNLINQYILKEPLSQKEIDTITRDDAFPSDVFFGPKGQFYHDRFGNWMLNNENVIKINGLLHIYDDGLYYAKAEAIEKVILDKLPALKNNQRQEVLKYLRIRCKKETVFAEPRYIGLKSRIYDIETGSHLDYGPEYVMPNKLPYDYDPQAYDITTDKVLNKISCGDVSLRQLIEEMIGYCLYRRNELGKAFILTEDGSNGKSTLLCMIKKLLGQNNCTSLEPKDLNTRFLNAHLQGKLANLGDDISSSYIENSSILKKLITGEQIIVEHKGEQPFELQNYAKMIFCANEIPRINDSSDGLLRRLIIIPFKAKFSETDPDYDPFIIDKLCADAAMEYLLTLAIDGLKRVLDNRQFTACQSVKDELGEYDLVNNPVRAFVESGVRICNETTKDIYLKYDLWCKENGLKALSNIQFGRILSKRFGIESVRKTVAGESIRIYSNKVPENADELQFKKVINPDKH